MTKKIPSPLLNRDYYNVWFPSKEKKPINEPLIGEFTSIYPVDSNQMLLKKALDSIHTAKETIFIASFLFSNKQITDALKDAAKRDVRIYLLTASEDKLRTSPEEGDFENRTLEEHKKFLNEMSQLILIRSANNFHFKLLLVDAANEFFRNGFIFTSNLTDKALSENAELGVVLNGDQIIDLAKYFIWCFWEKATHEQTLNKQHQSIKNAQRYLPAKPESSVILSGAGIIEEYSIKKNLFDLVDSAKISLEIASFSFGEKDSILTQKICEKAKSGVSVQLYARETRYKQFELFSFLQENGIQIIGIPLLHLKLIIADNNKGILMTANLDDRSLSSSMEVGLQLNQEQVTICKNILEAYRERFHLQYFKTLQGEAILKKKNNTTFIAHYQNDQKEMLSIMQNSPEHIEKKKVNCVTDLLRLKPDNDALDKYNLVESIVYKWEIELPVLEKSYIQSKGEKEVIFPIYTYEEKNKKGKIVKKEKVFVLDRIDDDLKNIEEATLNKQKYGIARVVVRGLP